MLQDCNLVLYTAANAAIYNSNTYNPANAPCTLSVLSAVGGYIEVDTSAGAAVFRQPPNPGALKTGQQLPQVGAPSPHPRRAEVRAPRHAPLLCPAQTVEMRRPVQWCVGRQQDTPPECELLPALRCKAVRAARHASVLCRARRQIHLRP